MYKQFKLTEKLNFKLNKKMLKEFQFYCIGREDDSEISHRDVCLFFYEYIL